MQKSGINFFYIVPRTIVPLDSAVINLVYTAYFSAFDGFLQACFLYKTPAGSPPVEGGARRAGWSFILLLRSGYFLHLKSYPPPVIARGA